MTQDYKHPITPPPEEIGDWWSAWDSLDESERPRLEDFIAIKAAQWGADQELEACCDWAKQFNYDDEYYEDKLRTARRPKPQGPTDEELTWLWNHVATNRRQRMTWFEVNCLPETDYQQFARSVLRQWGHSAIEPSLKPSSHSN
jgi:hypothetical protein